GEAAPLSATRPRIKRSSAGRHSGTWAGAEVVTSHERTYAISDSRAGHHPAGAGRSEGTRGQQGRLSDAAHEPGGVAQGGGGLCRGARSGGGGRGERDVVHGREGGRIEGGGAPHQGPAAVRGGRGAW